MIHAIIVYFYLDSKLGIVIKHPSLLGAHSGTRWNSSSSSMFRNKVELYFQQCLSLGCFHMRWLLPYEVTASILEWVAISYSKGVVFLTQGLNPRCLGLLHWQADSLPLAPPQKLWNVYWGIEGTTWRFGHWDRPVWVWRGSVFHENTLKMEWSYVYSVPFNSS